MYENITELWLEEDHYKWRALRSAGVRDRVLVMVGGIPVTAAYAKRIGADIWSSDGFDAAEKAEAALLEKRRGRESDKEEKRNA